SDRPFMSRAAEWRLEELPVPAEILVYTLDEWKALLASGSRFARMLEADCVWLPIEQRKALS
ncbi:MAG: nucleotidyltransferase domain-containing protein, partial [Vicinamibacteria bacterium]